MATRRKRTEDTEPGEQLTRGEARAKVRAGEPVRVGEVIVTGQRVTDGVVEWEVDGEWIPRYQIEDAT